MPSSVFAVVIDCRDPSAIAQFWAAATGGDVVERNTDEFKLTPADQGTPLYFMKVPESKAVKNRIHLDLLTEGTLDAEVERLVGLGALLVEVRQDDLSLANPDTWAVMLDPEGNEFCVDSRSTLTGW